MTTPRRLRMGNFKTVSFIRDLGYLIVIAFYEICANESMKIGWGESCLTEACGNPATRQGCLGILFC